MPDSGTTPVETFSLGSFEFRSRLIVGSGKYESFEQNLACIEAAGAEAEKEDFMIVARLGFPTYS